MNQQAPLPHPFRPPTKFLPARDVTAVKVMEKAPSFIVRTKAKGKRRAGLIYEDKAITYLGEKSDFFFPGPWLAFTARGSQRVRWCQPDGIIFDFVQGRITIVEVKLRHTVQAWWQLRQLYEPVVRKLFEAAEAKFSVLEVTQSIDPHLAFPEHFHFARDPAAVRDGAFGVHIYNPRRD